MSYTSVGATNFAYNYSLLSNGCCYDSITKKCVDAKAYCAGDLAASGGKTGSLYKLDDRGLCINTATGKFADLKWCQGPTKPAEPSTLDKILTGFAIFGQRQQAAAPRSTTPKWLLPVGVAALGLGVVLIATKPKRSAPSSSAPAPTSNPARRRRRRR